MPVASRYSCFSVEGSEATEWTAPVECCSVKGIKSSIMGKEARYTSIDIVSSYAPVRARNSISVGRVLVIQKVELECKLQSLFCIEEWNV